MTVKERAVEYHDRGCNCAQSVLCALSDYTGLDEQTAKCISADSAAAPAVASFAAQSPAVSWRLVLPKALPTARPALQSPL